MPVTQKELIRNSAKYFPNKPAVVYEDKSLTFREVDQRANRLANALAGLGLKPGARVATAMRNCLEYIEITFGLIKGSFPQLQLNPRLTSGEILYQLNDADVEAVIMQKRYAELISPVRDQLKSVKHFICFDGEETGTLDYETLLSKGKTVEPKIELNLDDLGELRYTSGTTGVPKGIMLPYRSWLAVTRNLLLDQIPDMTSLDRFVALQPLYHGAGWRILAVWVRGATHYIVPRFDPEIAFNLIEKEKITSIKTVPTVLLRLLDAPDIRKRNLKSVHTILYGASPMPVERLKQGLDIFGRVFVQGFGQTEAPVTICVLRKEDHILGDPEKEKRLASVGRPYTMVEVRIVDEKGKDVKAGALGEIIVRGDHMMTGFLNNPEATAERIRNGWIYTNDLATFDNEGYIFLTGGRKTDMIKTGGLQVYPVEVEQVLYQHPAIAECAVIGVPDPTWVEAIKACVVVKPGSSVTETELIDFCRERLAGYKKPKTVDFLPELPKNAAGKILHRELRKKYVKK